MWYKKTISSSRIQFHVKDKIRCDFENFCFEEIFLEPSKVTIDDLLQSFSKDIFIEPLADAGTNHFMAFVFSYLHETKQAFDKSSLDKFFSSASLSNPLHLLLMANNHLYPTVKNACKFLNAVHPSESPHAWNNYLADSQAVFSDAYFVSSHYKSVLQEKKDMLIAYMVKRQDIALSLKSCGSYNIFIPALLKTNLVLKKEERYKELIQELFRQEIISPTLPYQGQIIFEHAMNRPRNSGLWWLEDMLLNFDEYFNFPEMIDYFESQMTPGFYLEEFKNEFQNYKEIIALMKKISFKKSMENNLLEKNLQKINKI